MAQSTRKWCQCQPSRTQQICFSKEAKQLPYSLTFILWNLPNHTLRVYSELKDFWTANEHITSVLRAFLIHSLPHTLNKCSTMQFLTRGLDSEWTSSLEHTRVLCFVLVFFFLHCFQLLLRTPICIYTQPGLFTRSQKAVAKIRKSSLRKRWILAVMLQWDKISEMKWFVYTAIW